MDPLIDNCAFNWKCACESEALRRMEFALAALGCGKYADAALQVLMPSRKLTQAETSVKTNLVNTNVYTISEFRWERTNITSTSFKPLLSPAFAHNCIVTCIVDNNGRVSTQVFRFWLGRDRRLNMPRKTSREFGFQ